MARVAIIGASIGGGGVSPASLRQSPSQATTPPHLSMKYSCECPALVSACSISCRTSWPFRILLLANTMRFSSDHQ